MRIKNASVIIGLSAILGLSACAQSKKASSAASANNNREYVTLIEASKQMSRHVKPRMEYNFFVRWENNMPPEAFYWRESDNWMPCLITKASKATPGKHWEGAEKVMTENIKKGDTLLLIPQAGGKYPIPAVIPADAKNTIFYKTANTGWMALPVKNIKEK